MAPALQDDPFSTDGGRWRPGVPMSDEENRLENIIGWVRTAKENLPSINDGQVTSDRISAVSALLDRLHQNALGLRARLSAKRDRRAA